VLPNSPSIIYPGKNHGRLVIKRNALLLKLKTEGVIDQTTYELSLTEPLPGPPKHVPQNASHLMLRAEKEGEVGNIIYTTLNWDLQAAVEGIVEKHHRYWRQNEIHNMAAIVTNTKTGEVIAYVGNTQSDGKAMHQEMVDIVSAPRSTGSILKPFLFASVLQDGLLYPSSLVQDIPLHIHGYSPKNFNLTFDGVVPAKRALGRSLNVPAVKMLQQLGTEKLMIKLRKCGMTTLSYSAKHYGLALILGGAEGTLWDLTQMYVNLSRSAMRLPNIALHFKKASRNEFRSNLFNSGISSIFTKSSTAKDYSFPAGVAWLTLEAMLEVARPDLESSWREFSSGNKIAWKTGTSFGFRDGWAIGTNPNYTVGVWVGNANGEGRPGLTGISAAAPVLFDIFSALPRSNWFVMPRSDLKQIKLCSESGYPPSQFCPKTKTEWVQNNLVLASVCPYHKTVFLNKEGTSRVSANCYAVSEMRREVYFVLPPVEEWYYKSQNPGFRNLPPFLSSCDPSGMNQDLGLIYPTPNAAIFIPRNNENLKLGIVCRATHKNYNAAVYWTMDGEFLKTTTNLHEIVINPTPGNHKLNITDQQGERCSVNFSVIAKD